MSWQDSSARSIVVLALVAAVGVSCRGQVESDTVAGVSRVSALPADTEWGGLSASQTEVLLCHKGKKDIRVPPSDVADHLAHGDFIGSCTVCPCFTAADIQAVAAQCQPGLEPTCAPFEPYGLLLVCNPGVSETPFPIGLFLTSSGGSCQWDDFDGDPYEESGLTEGEYEACANAISSSGYCQ